MQTLRAALCRRTVHQGLTQQARMIPIRFESVAKPSNLEEHGFESTTIEDILKGKGKGADGSWLFCSTDDTVYDAVKSMTNHNVGALVVVKKGEKGAIAGIITERDYLRKIIVQGRSSKTTRVGDIMTEENKLITVTPSTRVLKAMELMTEKRIRHIPVVKDKKMLGMVSIGDVVRAVVDEHREELKRLNTFIQGGYWFAHMSSSSPAPPTMLVVHGHHHHEELSSRASVYVVSASTCAKVALLSFGIGVIVGFNLNKRVRKFASRMLKKLKEP